MRVAVCLDPGTVEADWGGQRRRRYNGWFSRRSGGRMVVDVLWGAWNGCKLVSHVFFDQDSIFGYLRWLDESWSAIRRMSRITTTTMALCNQLIMNISLTYPSKNNRFYGSNSYCFFEPYKISLVLSDLKLQRYNDWVDGIEIADDTRMSECSQFKKYWSKAV